MLMRKKRHASQSSNKKFTWEFPIISIFVKHKFWNAKKYSQFENDFEMLSFYIVFI